MVEQLSRPAVGCQEPLCSLSLCSPGMERVKCGGAGAAGELGARLTLGPRRASSASSPCRRTPNPETAHGTATRCTRARAVGGRPARAPCKRRAHAGVSGRGQPSDWRGSRGARRAPGGGKARSIAALARTGAWRLRPCHPHPRHPIHRRARTGARECSHTHARLRTPWPGCVSWARVGAGVEGESGELRAMR